MGKKCNKVSIEYRKEGVGGSSFMLNVKIVDRAGAVHPSNQRVAPVITKTKEEEKTATYDAGK